jgi:putative transposase
MLNTTAVLLHCTERYENNRAKASHERTRSRKRQMGKFKSSGQARRFVAGHDRIQNLFRRGRNQTQAVNVRILRKRAFADWRQVTYA